MKIDPIADIVAAEPIGAGVTVHRHGPGGAACLLKEPESPARWFARQRTFAVSVGAKPCRKKACFSAKGGG